MSIHAPPRRRLLWIHQNFVSARQGGNSRPVAMVAALLEAGWEIDLVATHASYLSSERGTSASGVAIEREGGLTIHRLLLRHEGAHSRRTAYLDFVIASTRYLRALPRPDAVFCSSPPLTQLLPAIFAALRWRVPLVLEIRDLWPALPAQAGMIGSPALVLALEWLEALGYRMSSAPIVTAPAQAAYLARFGRGIPTLMAPSGGDARWLESAASPGRDWKRELVPKGELLVVYAGSLHETYDIRLLLEATRLSAEAMPGTTWVFAGDGRDRGLVVAAAREQRNVRYLGLLAKDEIRSLLLTADVALAPHAGWPLLAGCISGKLTDYMIAALPIVTLRAGTMRTIVEESGAGISAPSATAEGLVAAIRDLAARTPSERRALGLAGRRWVLRHADAAVWSRRVAEHIDHAVSGAHVQRATERLVRCAARATVDVVHRRGRRAAEFLPTADGDAATRRELDAWLRIPPEPARPLRIPRILSQL